MADTPRMSALQNIASNIPVMNARIAQQKKAARDLQLQQAVVQAPAQGATPQVAQQLGAAVAQNAGAQAVQTAQQALTQNNAVADLGAQEQNQANNAVVSDLAAGSRDLSMENAQKLAAVSERAKQEIYDSRLQFSKDESGRQFLNDRQLDDFAAMNAKSEADFQSYAQRMEQGYKKKQLLLDTSLKKITQELTSSQVITQRLLDQANDMSLSKQERDASAALYQKKVAQAEELYKREADLKILMAKQAAKSNNRKAQGAAIGQVLGTVIGAGIAIYATGGLGVAGAPAAGAAGGAAGGAIGGGIGSMVS